MTKQLWRTIIIIAFGQGSERPIRAAFARLILAGACALGLGLVVGRMVASAELPQDIPGVWVAALVSLSSYSIAGFVFLLLGASSGGGGARASLQKMAATLPLSRRAHWCLRATGSLIIAGIMMIFSTPGIIALSKVLHQPWLIMLAALYGGVLFGLSATLFTKPRGLVTRGVFLVFSIVVGIWLLSHSIDSAAQQLLVLPIAGVYAIIFGAGLGFWQSYRSIEIATSARNRAEAIGFLPLRLLRGWWFVIKLARNRRSIISGTFCFVLVGVVAVAVAAKHLGAAGGVGWLLFGAIITAAFACDVRGLTPRTRAPEIETLNGAGYFVASQVRSTLVVAILLSLPLLMVLLGSNPSDAFGLTVYYVSLQFSAALIGLLASELFVPRAGDIGAQFFAAALATTAVLAVPKLAHFSSSNNLVQIISWLAVGIICYCAMYVIEGRRRSNYGTV